MARSFDFNGQICPMPVINTIKQFARLKVNESMEVLTDDPLAVKSIPEELNAEGVDVNVEKLQTGWRITLTRVR